MEITGGNTTVTADVDDIKARATAAFTESVKKVIICLFLFFKHSDYTAHCSFFTYGLLVRGWKRKETVPEMKCNFHKHPASQYRGCKSEVG